MNLFALLTLLTSTCDTSERLTSTYMLRNIQSFMVTPHYTIKDACVTRSGVCIFLALTIVDVRDGFGEVLWFSLDGFAHFGDGTSEGSHWWMVAAYKRRAVRGTACVVLGMTML